MKRRGFFGAIAGLVGAGAAAKAAEVTSKVEKLAPPEVLPPAEKLPPAKTIQDYIDEGILQDRISWDNKFQEAGERFRQEYLGRPADTPQGWRPAMSGDPLDLVINRIGEVRFIVDRQAKGYPKLERERIKAYVDFHIYGRGFVGLSPTGKVAHVPADLVLGRAEPGQPTRYYSQHPHYREWSLVPVEGIVDDPLNRAAWHLCEKFQACKGKGGSFREGIVDKAGNVTHTMPQPGLTMGAHNNWGDRLIPEKAREDVIGYAEFDNGSKIELVRTAGGDTLRGSQLPLAWGERFEKQELPCDEA